MSLTRVRKPTLIVLSFLLVLVVLSLSSQPTAPASGGNAIALKAPSFVSVANAQDAPDATPMGFPQDEAGISAYFKSATLITLADVRSEFRVIEAETADYIIGSVPVPTYEERYDVHLYVHRDGWFLAYYLAADPVAKVIDWQRYTPAKVATKLDYVLAVVAGSAGVPFSEATYYDFRYPNANNLMIIAEDNLNGNDFQVNLPGTFTYYARSWSFRGGGGHTCCGSSSLTLDGTTLTSMGGGPYQYREGNLTSGQLLPDTYHTIVAYAYYEGQITNGALVLVYRVP
jgi:hypothetical protein